MIHVQIHLLSAVNGKKTLIGEAVIANDGTGTVRNGNYKAKFASKRSGKVWAEAAIQNFPRLSRNVWFLLHRLLTVALKSK
jgi:hypothetical protein